MENNFAVKWCVSLGSRLLLSANPPGGLRKTPQWLLLKTLMSFPSGTSRVHCCHITFKQSAYSLLFLLLLLCSSQWFHSAIKVLYIWRTNRNSAWTDREILFTFVSLNYFFHQFSPISKLSHSPAREAFPSWVETWGLAWPRGLY